MASIALTRRNGTDGVELDDEELDGTDGVELDDEELDETASSGVLSLSCSSVSKRCRFATQ
jgi:hypothetical protein